MSKKYLYILNFLLLFFILNAQKTLYWIGGTGKWNDPQHWSLTSGGTPCGHLPDANTKAIIDEASSKSNMLIEFHSDIKISGLEVKNSFFQVFIDTKNHSLLIDGDIIIHPNCSINTSKPIIVTNTKKALSYVFFYAKLNNALVLKNGHFQISNLFTDSLNLDNALLNIINGHLETQKLTSISSLIEAQSSVLKIDKITNKSISFNISQSHFVTKEDSAFVKTLIKNNINSKIYTPDWSPTSCIASATLTGYSTSCFGTCDGSLVLTISSTGCSTSTPFQLQWPSGCSSTPTLTSVAGNGSYTITNLCQCSPYQVDIHDNNNNFLTSALGYVNQPGALILVKTSDNPPLCNGQCNGSITLNALQGSYPPTGYTITVDGINTYTIPQGNTTYTNLCAGTHTFVLKDANGCTKTTTITLSQPPLCCLMVHLTISLALDFAMDQPKFPHQVEHLDIL